MARELGMNPKKLGGLANHRQEPWKRPLPEFIETLYERRFGRRRPERVVSIEERAAGLARKKTLQRALRAAKRSHEERRETEADSSASHALSQGLQTTRRRVPARQMNVSD